MKKLHALMAGIAAGFGGVFGTPWAGAVLGFALTLEERRSELDQETIDEIVADIAQAARRLERLLADLLDIERCRRTQTVVGARDLPCPAHALPGNRITETEFLRQHVWAQSAATVLCAVLVTVALVQLLLNGMLSLGGEVVPTVSADV